MALDRQESKAQIAANNVPTVTNAINNTMLQNNILDNVVLRKDEKSSASGAGLATYTANFANNEQVILTGVNQNIAISFSNLEDGDVRYLYITKGAANVVSFTGALDMTQNRFYIDNFATSSLYRITSKNGVIYVEAINSPSIQSWVSVTPAANWSGTIKYRINYFTGKVELYISVTSTGALINSIIGTIPAIAWPAVTTPTLVYGSGILLNTGLDFANISVSNINGNILLTGPSFST